MKNMIRFMMVVITFVLGTLGVKNVYASSASVSFYTDAENITVGQTFIVTLTAESSAGIKDFQTYVSYDTSALELIDTGNHVTGGDGLILVQDVGNEESNVRQYRMKFKAIKEGTSEVYISDKVYIYEASTGKEMSVSKNVLKVNVQKDETKKEQNKGLGSLSIEGTVLEPAFDENITQYRAQVEADVDMVYIDAKAKLKAYNVKIEGNTNLQMGDNTVKVIVTDKNGIEKIYTILVHRSTKAEEVLKEEQEKEEIDNREEVNGKEFSAYKREDGILFQTSGIFQVVPIPDNGQVPDGFKEDTLKIHGISVTVYMPNKDLASDFVLVYGRWENEAAGFYFFDRIEETIQRYTGESTVVVSANNEKSEEKKIGALYLINFILVGIVIMLLIIIIHNSSDRSEH